MKVKEKESFKTSRKDRTSNGTGDWHTDATKNSD